ncbi:MAG TPA: hypothetical protein VFL12_03550 [Thermoanaerobaculia bacterium]|nr:hypothetical protein [Thermoanaerobaculia bacterium]
MSRPSAGRSAAAVLGGAAAIALLEISRAAAGVPFSIGRTLERVLFLAVAVAVARRCRPRREGRTWIFPVAAGAAAVALELAAIAAAAVPSGAAAEGALALFFGLTLAAALPGGDSARGEAARERTVFLAAVGRAALLAAVGRAALLAAAAGVVPMILLEIGCRFAHEELFVAAEAATLAAAWAALLPAAALGGPRASAGGIRVHSGALAAGAVALAAAGLGVAIAAYQASFSDPEPPGFPGISTAAPFLCGTAPPDSARYDGRRVFEDLLSAIAANPGKGAPEEAMLALATRDALHAERFRDALLREVSSGDLSRRGRTKFWQWAAALRAHYYPRVRDAFPGLFSAADRNRVASWFAAINRRALRVGPDDAIYALAYRKVPEGPYENQENGAALLAALETGGLADPAISDRNRRYLDRAARGWAGRWRNSDDSLSYQSEWITNAYLQSLRTGPPPIEAVRRSFDWILAQTPPDGFAPDYNPSGAPDLPTAYLGAEILRDPRLLWLAARTLSSAAKEGRPIWAQPGVERPVDGEGISPTIGNCLLYGPSGTPTRPGPLAPDKIVFRGGWRPEDPYLLVDLRFEGWHRYKATNTVTLLRAAGRTLAADRGGAALRFVPLERRLFRDKRIPRENLNGLLVEPAGLAAALSRLAGFGGPWAQDPPRTARVERFDPAAGTCVTAVEGWNGWRQRRTVDFRRDAPIVVVDEADGPGKAAIAWHVEGVPAGPGRFRLAGGAGELVLVAAGGSGSIEVSRLSDAPRLTILYRPVRPGTARLASVFLTGRWLGASVAVLPGNRPVLRIRGPAGTFTWPEGRIVPARG